MVMAKYNTPQEQKAYEIGKLDGMLYYQQHIIKNMKNEYEKLYKKRIEMENLEKK